MRSTFGGPIATLLICVPLIAVPIVAVFGMPQWASSSLSTPDDDLTFADDKAPAPKGAQSNVVPVPLLSQPAAEQKSPSVTEHLAADPHRDSKDPFAEFNAGAGEHTSRPSSLPAKNSWSPPQDRLQGWTLDDGHKSPQKPLPEDDNDSPAEPAKSKAIATMTGHRQSPEEAKRADAAGVWPAEADRTADAAKRQTAGGPLTWKAAVAQLNAFGIREYRLQPGSADGEIHFSCHYVSRDNPHVMHRFEAEASEPLEAFRKVLQQLSDRHHPSRDHVEQTSAPAPRRSMTSGRDVSSGGFSSGDDLSIDVTNR
jgi:hypothetical protein